MRAVPLISALRLVSVGVLYVFGVEHIPCILAPGLSLELVAIDMVHRVDEQDENTYKRNLARGMVSFVSRLTRAGGRAYFKTILQFCYNFALGYESEQLPASLEGHGHDETSEDEHLCHQKDEDLREMH